MHRHVELLIGRLVTDPALRRRFADHPEEALRAQGLELTELEREALAALDPDAIRAFAAALDARLRKASPALEERRIGGGSFLPESRTQRETDR